MPSNTEIEGSGLSAGYRALAGGLVGLVLGFAFVGVGMLRFTAATGRNPVPEITSDELRLGAYLIGAMLSGVVGGLVKPKARTMRTALLAGVLTFQPLLLAIIASMQFESGFNLRAAVFVWLIMTAVFGSVTGFVFLRNQ